MVLSTRKKLAIAPLLAYWPTIFVLTHIPIRHALKGITMSDKILHYLAYLILVVLLWFATNTGKKVNWRRAAVWWVLLVVVWYGACDEWLQSYAGRNSSLGDFAANLAGALTGLILLSIFPFWPVLLALSGAAMFVLSNFSVANFSEQLAWINTTFHLFAYGLFSLMWIWYMGQLLPVRAPQLKWIIGAIFVPLSLLTCIELFLITAGNELRMQDIAIPLAAIAIVTGAICLKSFFDQRSMRNRPGNSFEGSV